jgi:D-aspartate ligase
LLDEEFLDRCSEAARPDRRSEAATLQSPQRGGGFCNRRSEAATLGLQRTFVSVPSFLRPPVAPNAPALIVGDDPVSGLGVARNLGRLGTAVHRLGGTFEPLLQSRYIRTTRAVQNLDQLGDDDYLQVLEDTRHEIGGMPVLLPITDLHVLRQSRLGRDRLNGFHPTTPRPEIAEILVNKGRFYGALESLGIPHPLTRRPRTPLEFVAAAAEIGYPVYVKPEISPQFHRRFQRKGFVARNADELRAHVREVLRSGVPVVLQEVIPGGATCMHGVAGYRRGRETVWVCYRRVREYPAGFGCGSVIETCASFVHETRLLELLETIGYEGLFDAELKRDPRTGALSLIEINARSWWQNLLPTRSGINLIDLCYRDAAGLADGPLPAPEYRLGVKWIHLYNDISAARNEGLGWRAWLRSLNGPRVFAFHALDDPWPQARQLSWILRGKIRTRFKRAAVPDEPSLAPAPPAPESPQQA